jgi:hypothetical protein
MASPLAPASNGSYLIRSGGTSERRDGAPEKRDGAPEKRDGAPEKRGGTPERRDGAPEKRDGTEVVTSESCADEPHAAPHVEVDIVISRIVPAAEHRANQSEVQNYLQMYALPGDQLHQVCGCCIAEACCFSRRVMIPRHSCCCITTDSEAPGTVYMTQFVCCARSPRPVSGAMNPCICLVFCYHEVAWLGPGCCDRKWYDARWCRPGRRVRGMHDDAIHQGVFVPTQPPRERIRKSTHRARLARLGQALDPEHPAPRRRRGVVAPEPQEPRRANRAAVHVGSCTGSASSDPWAVDPWAVDPWSITSSDGISSALSGASSSVQVSPTAT